MSKIKDEIMRQVVIGSNTYNYDATPMRIKINEFYNLDHENRSRIIKLAERIDSLGTPPSEYKRIPLGSWTPTLPSGISNGAARLISTVPTLNIYNQLTRQSADLLGYEILFDAKRVSACLS